jgi:DNA-directed RNA polymerase subunit F
MITKEKALDILDRMDFFQGQRAGRELWNEKSRYVQEMDLQIFREDVAELKAYIADVVPKSEVERLEQDNEDLRNVLANTINKYRNCQAEVAKEIVEELERIGLVLRYEDYAELKKKYTEEKV